MDAITSEAKTKTRLFLNKWRMWAFPAGVLVFVVFSSLVLVVPQISKLVTLRSDLDNAEKKLQQISRKRTFLAGLTQSDTLNQLDVVLRVLPNSKPVFAVLSSFEGLAQELGVAVADYSLNPGTLTGDNKEKLGELISIPIKLTVVGSLDAINTFITRIEYVAPLVQVEKVQVDRLRVSSETATHEAQIELLVFYSPPPATKGSTAAALKSLDDSKLEVLSTLATYTHYDQLTDTFEASAATGGREDPFYY